MLFATDISGNKKKFDILLKIFLKKTIRVKEKRFSSLPLDNDFVLNEDSDFFCN